EAIASENPRGTFDFVWTHDFEAIDAIASSQMVAQCNDIRVIVHTTARRPRIGDTEARIRHRRNPVFVNGFVGGRAFVPADVWLPHRSIRSRCEDAGCSDTCARRATD